MSTQTEEVRTTFVWDTSDVDRGVKRVESALDRMKQAETSANRKRGGGHASAGFGGNLSAGLKDLAEGRVMNAATRLGAAFRVGGPIVGGALMAVKVMRDFNQQLEEAQKRTDSLQSSSTRWSREARFTSAGDSTERLGAVRESLRGARDEENEHAVHLDHLKHVRDHNPISRFAFGTMEKVGGFFGRQSLDLQQQGSNIRSKLNTGQDAQLAEKSLQRSRMELAIQKDLFQGLDLAAAKTRERLEYLREETELKKRQGDQSPELPHLREAYRLRETALDREQELRDVRTAGARAALALESSNLSIYQKRLGVMKEELRTTKEQLATLGEVTSERAKALQLQAGGLENQIRLAEQGRHLNPDGTKKRAGEIHRQERQERNETRLRNRFDRRRRKPDIDKVDDQRPLREMDEVIEDEPGTGLKSGSLSTGNLHSSKPLRAGRGLSDDALWGAKFAKVGDRFHQYGDRTVRGTMGMDREMTAGGRSTEAFRKEFAPRNPRTLEILNARERERGAAAEGESDIRAEIMQGSRSSSLRSGGLRTGNLDLFRKNDEKPSGGGKQGGEGNELAGKIDKLITLIDIRLPKAK